MSCQLWFGVIGSSYSKAKEFEFAPYKLCGHAPAPSWVGHAQWWGVSEMGGDK